MPRIHYSLMFVCVAVALVGCGKKATTPEETIKTFSQAMIESKPDVAWELMPASYQTDVNGVVSAAAEKIDPDVHAKTVSTLKSLVSVLKNKKDYILATPMAQQNPAIKIDDVKKNYDSFVGILDTVVESDLSNLDALKKANVGKMLKSSGRKLMEEFKAVSAALQGDEMNRQMNLLKEIQIKTLSNSGTEAELETTFDGKTTREKMTKVEEKWVPAEMAAEWSSKIADTKKNIASSPMMENKLQVLGILGAASTILEQLDKAKSQAEFDQMLMSGMMNFKR